MKKTSIRNNLKAARNKLDPEMRKKTSETIFQRLKSRPVYEKSDSVFIFVSMGSEVETIEWIPEILKEKKVYVPLAPKGGAMIMTEIKGLDELAPNSLGILELPQEKINDRRRENVDLIITPGLAFDGEGYRMGYGGGYYDRFFATHDGYRLGVGFHDQLVTDLPRDEYDLPVDAFLSEKDYLSFS